MMQPVRHAPQLAQWFNERGCEVMQWNPDVDMEIENGVAVNTESLLARGLSLEDIQAGDLVFFAEKVGGEFVEQNDYRHISHVAIVTKAECTRDTDGNPVGWDHEIIEVISSTSALAHGAQLRERDYLCDEATLCEFVDDWFYDTMQIRSLWADPGVGLEFDGSLAWGGTMVMVCRPQLTDANADFGLIAEALKLGLHEMPKNWGTLNVVRRARQYTDVKWTPAVDLRRYTLKYGSSEDPVFYQNARFKAGVEYTGVPAVGETWPVFHSVGNDCGFTAFVTSMAVENTENTSYDPDEDGVMDLASGWRTPTDLLRYAFDVPVYVKGSGITGYFDVTPTNSIELGDVFGDEAIVTDIIRKDGTLCYIEVCIAAYDGCDNSSDLEGPKGGVAVRRLMTYDEFDSIYRGDTSWEQLPVGRRYNDIESVEYYPDPYAPVSESNYNLTRNLPIVPYYGHKSVQCINVSDLEPDQGMAEYATLLVPNDAEYTELAYDGLISPLTEVLDENGRICIPHEINVVDYNTKVEVHHEAVALAESAGDGVHYCSVATFCTTLLHGDNPSPGVVYYDDVNKRFILVGIDLAEHSDQSANAMFVPRYIRWEGSYYPFIRVKKPAVGLAGYGRDELLVTVDEAELRKDTNGNMASLPLTVTVGYSNADGGASFEVQTLIPDHDA